MTEKFSTGAQRDTQDGKPRFDLIDLSFWWSVADRLSGDLFHLCTTITQHKPKQTETVRLAAHVIKEEYKLCEIQTDSLRAWPYAALERLAQLLRQGAEHYGANNWRKGIPVWRINASLHRHFWAWVDGQDDEDHFAAILFNCMAICYVTKEVAAGRLPDSLLADEDEKEENSLPNVAACSYYNNLSGECCNDWVSLARCPHTHPVNCSYAFEDGVKITKTASCLFHSLDGTCCNDQMELTHCPYGVYNICGFYREKS
jgi:hypothetical protein